MTFELGYRPLKAASKLGIALAIALALALLQISAFSPAARAADSQAATTAASPTAGVTNCDTAIGAMNKTLILIAKRRIAVRTAKAGGPAKVKRAKKALQKAQARGKALRAAIRRYCGAGSGVSASDAECSRSITKLSSSLELAYKRKLMLKKVKGHSAKAKRIRRKMRTQLKKLRAQVQVDTSNFGKSCGGNGGDNGSGNGGNHGNGGNGNPPADTTPPGDVTIEGPQSPTNDNTPTFTITPPADETGGHIECKIDDGDWQTVTSPYTADALADGAHIIVCRYVDAAGNAGGETAFAFTIDTTPPGDVTIDGPSGSTNDTTPTFNLSGAEPGDHYECSVDGGPFGEVTSPFTTDELAEGTHTITCHLVDEAGNTGNDATVTIDVDTTNTDTVEIDGPSGPTSDNTPTIEITTPDGPGHLECKIDDGDWLTVTSPWTLPELADGVHTITCHWVDGAGNAGPDTTFTLTIDTTPPGAVTMSGPSGPTRDNTPSYAISGGGEPVGYECSIDGGDYASVPAAYTTPPLADGAHTISCRAVDAAGNTGPSTTKTVDVDTTAPGPVTMSGPSGPTSDNTPTYAISGGEAGATYECAVDGGAYGAVSSPYTTPPLADGTHTTSCRAVDAAGNTGPSTTKTVNVDTTAPGAITISGPTGLTNSGSPSYTLGGAGAGESYQCKVDGGAYAAATSPLTPALADGTHTISCRAVDAAGNTGPAATATVTVDTTAPTVSIADGTARWDGTHSFTLTASETGVTYKCSIDGGAYNTVAASFTTGVLSNGTHSISCKATDAAGNTGPAASKSFGVFKDPAVVSKSGGFQWGLGCTLSNFWNALLGCPDNGLTITIPASPNGLTGSYLVDVSGYVKGLTSALGFGSTYKMYITVDGNSVASDSASVPFEICGLWSANLSAAQTNISLSSATAHTVQISIKTSALISVFPSVSSSQLSVSIHH